MKFPVHNTELEVEVLPFDDKELPDIAVLAPRGKSRSWCRAPMSGQCLKVVCELRYQHLARAFLDNAVKNYHLHTVYRKTEGYVSRGTVHAGIDVVRSGKSAERNGLCRSLRLVKCYPVILRNQGKRLRFTVEGYQKQDGRSGATVDSGPTTPNHCKCSAR